jgi:hypothetical protein
VRPFENATGIAMSFRATAYEPFRLAEAAPVV